MSNEVQLTAIVLAGGQNTRLRKVIGGDHLDIGIPDSYHHAQSFFK